MAKKTRKPRSGDCLRVTDENSDSWAFVVLSWEDEGETWVVIRQGSDEIERIEMDEIWPRDSTFEIIPPQSIGRRSADEVAQWMYEYVQDHGELEQEIAANHIRKNFGNEFVEPTAEGGYSIVDRVRRRFKKLHGGSVTYMADRAGGYWSVHG